VAVTLAVLGVGAGAFIPPNLGQEAPPDARRAFWTIKHGIKMSAMPAWGKTLDAAAIRDLVALVRGLPDLTPQAYQQLAH
jgi:mono/diheme cytochrome c family protein